MLSDTLERLQTLIHTLEQSTHTHASLGFVFPSYDPPVGPPALPFVDRWDLDYPDDLQPFSDLRMTATFEIGRDPSLFGRLGPLLLASIIKPCPTLDFKAFYHNACVDFEESHILSPLDKTHDTREIRQVIHTWIQMCEIPKSTPQKTFRRCIIIGFISHFHSDEDQSLHEVGHSITLGLEIKDRVLTLRIFDYRMHEYVYNVHDQLFQFMTDEARQFSAHYDSLHTETVCLKGKLHVDKEFMTCMSASFRVCLYLSKDTPLYESDKDFETDSLNLPNHIWRMFEWVKGDRRLIDKHNTLIVSPQMAGLVFEINNETCYLMLAPYRLPKHLRSKQKDLTAIATDISRTATRLRYSLTDGFVESST